MYCFGDPKKMSDENSKLALRIHDEVSVACALMSRVVPRRFANGGVFTFCDSATEAMSSVLTSAHAGRT